jgi:hypothetical protein
MKLFRREDDLDDLFPDIEETGPESRLVGRLIVDALAICVRRLGWALLIGVAPVATFALGFANLDAVLLFPLVMTASFVGAAMLVSAKVPPSRQQLRAYLASLAVFLPAYFVTGLLVYVSPLFFPLLALSVLPFWFAYFGLAPVVAVVEGRGVRDSLRRARALARADLRHVFGVMITLSVLCFGGGLTLFLVLWGLGTPGATAGLIAAFLFMPLLQVGGALVYFDQEARMRVEAEIEAERLRERRRYR